MYKMDGEVYLLKKSKDFMQKGKGKNCLLTDLIKLQNGPWNY